MKQTKTGAAPAKAASNAVSGYDWSQVGTTGFEQVQRSDLGIPFLAIIQDGSPEFKKSDPNHPAKKIDGCSPGDIFNNLTREIYHQQGKTPAIFVPCGFETMYVEWKPRTSGGGFVRAHKNANILNECTRNDRNQDVHKNGNLVVTTAYYYGLILRGEDRVPCMLGMTSTQLKKSRFWLNLMQGLKFERPDGSKFQAPMFSHSYALSTQPESNEEGSWWGWKIAVHEKLKDAAVIEDAVDTAKKALAGQRTALPTPTDDKDEVPFS